ncbi:Hypothetical predicted protein [Cloeon dipterum]|nr:Hypothetical predicted protein [Cloeon dipterum]
MAPRGSSFPGLWKYPSNRDIWAKSSLSWLEGRRKDDGAHGLWRIHDHLYDFSTFVDSHPGGADWLQLTKGTDITEAFEVHHLTSLPRAMLDKYKVRPTSERRNSPYTFLPDGFYNTFKTRVLQKFSTSQLKGPSAESKLVTDSLFSAFVVCTLISAYKSSIDFAMLAGVLLAFTVCAAHNFVHMRNEWRRNYVNLSMLSAKHFRIYHTLSHHLYPNSVLDLEVSLLEPWLPWLPRPEKNVLERYVSWLISPIVYTLMFPSEFARRVISHGPDLNDLSALLVPAAMGLVSPASLYLWPVMILTASFVYSLTSINAGHHHPEVVHDGDAARKDRDWGLAQVDCVIDRGDLIGVSVSTDGAISSSGSWWHFVLVLCNFGHHTLHHLMPTVDHFRLRQMYPILEQTLADFGIRYRVDGAIPLVSSQFQQLARNEPNPLPPEEREKKMM